jgi:hypothetical protein
MLSLGIASSLEKGVVVRTLPDPLQLLVSHRWHTLHQTVLIMSQQHPN